MVDSQAAMEQSLQLHITHLEQRLNALNQELMDAARTRAERNRVESQIRMAQMALTYYQKAIELEKQIG
jgi:hypothetical protein